MPDHDDDYQGPEHRQHQRLSVEDKLRAVITGADGTKTEAAIRDISEGGAALIVGTNFYNEMFVDLHMEGIGKVNARVARQFREGIGVEFSLSERERAEIKDELAKFRKAGGGESH